MQPRGEQLVQVHVQHLAQLEAVPNYAAAHVALVVVQDTTTPFPTPAVSSRPPLPAPGEWPRPPALELVLPERRLLQEPQTHVHPQVLAVAQKGSSTPPGRLGGWTPGRAGRDAGRGVDMCLSM